MGLDWDEWLGAEDVARRLRISLDTARQIIASRDIPSAIALRDSRRRVLVHPDDVATYIERSRIRPVSK